MSGEKLSADHEAAKKFLEIFKKETVGYDPDLIYNAGLNWKAFPRKTLASK